VNELWPNNKIPSSAEKKEQFATAHIPTHKIKAALKMVLPFSHLTFEIGTNNFFSGQVQCVLPKQERGFLQETKAKYKHILYTSRYNRFRIF
jgi:hypothetical protein